ncbi:MULTISPECIES: hypothetical protein [Erythrobacter]|uniref:Uncharacterized protein n=1 Tax=Erythrobacter aureus TaxID=2182384 RepID=A0A345YG88_9SPHN|nr:MULTISPECIES: hypothetical protein [Erythrobacter]AXK42940.1 hypothetical protein DVR09_11920 [Erythrobacter aureus]MCF8881732.1 hypothetical protein [Erythrobacter sp. SN021]
MDLNGLLHEHQVAVMKAAASGDGSARDNHFAKVVEYAERVRALRRIDPMTKTPASADGPPTIIYGSYAGETSAPSHSAPIASWEDEGGALNPPEVTLPRGVTSKALRQYYVGPYVYQDLDLAVAEHLRQLSAAARPTA